MEDKYKERVELNCHSRYSAMDGVSPVYEIVDCARANKMPYLALTDCMTVAGWEWLRECAESAGETRPIYGMEACVVDELMPDEPFWITILVKKEEGRQELFRLITEAENRGQDADGFAHIYWSELSQKRSSFLIGSGGARGELYRSLIEQEYGRKDEDELLKIAERYDFIEVLPVSAKRHLLDGRYPGFKDEEKLLELDKKLIKLAEKCKIPAVAVSAAYYLEEDDAERRAILRNADGAPEDNESDLHFRTTAEMLSEFSYLDEETAWKLVVENTNKVAEKIETFSLRQEEQLWPKNPNAELMLFSICQRRIMELYGDEVPDEIMERLAWEQECLSESGEATIVLLVAELVRMSGLTTYEIGYRGFLGNSLVAYLCGITCVNPLETKPPMEPEAAFGAEGEKILGIELNVPEEAYERVRGIWSSLDGVAEAYAFGQPQRLSPLGSDRALSEYEHRYGIRFEKERREAIELSLCQDIKKTKNAHQGAMLLVPEGCDITKYTPIITADDRKSKFTGLPKMALDFFYRVDIYPSESVGMVSDLMKRTGISVAEISTEDQKVMDSFKDRSAIGVPEFNTKKSWEILDTLKPSDFSDLVRASGLDHATGAWEQNAQFLLKEGIIKKEEVLGTLDDVYDYIMSLGMEREFAFGVVESIRKGRVFSGKDKRWKKSRTLLRTAGAADHFIWSCERIKYLFPRGYVYRHVLDAW
jgi:DNA polymerase-3 subunit alpha (Gram-positive type)